MCTEVTKSAKTTVYNVICAACGLVFCPTPNTPAWWIAKKRAEETSFIDAAHVSGKHCGCEQPRIKPNAPFRVFGYTDDLVDFDIPCDTFVQAIRQYKHFRRSCVVFITGVSEVTRLRLDSW